MKQNYTKNELFNQQFNFIQLYSTNWGSLQGTLIFEFCFYYMSMTQSSF